MNVAVSTRVTDVHTYEPAKGHGLKHDPLTAIIAPRPIGWVASMGAKGNVNLAPYSFFNIFNYKPPILAFSSNGWKDTVRNIEETGEFTWNLVTMPLAAADEHDVGKRAAGRQRVHDVRAHAGAVEVRQGAARRRGARRHGIEADRGQAAADQGRRQARRAGWSLARSSPYMSTRR